MANYSGSEEGYEVYSSSSSEESRRERSREQNPPRLQADDLVPDSRENTSLNNSSPSLIKEKEDILALSSEQFTDPNVPNMGEESKGENIDIVSPGENIDIVSPGENIDIVSPSKREDSELLQFHPLQARGVKLQPLPTGYRPSMPMMGEEDFSLEEQKGDVMYPELIGLQPIQSPIFSEQVLRLENVHKTYLLGVEGVPALRGVSVTINKGEFICIYGSSGSGKTTMLNIIGTIDKPTKGNVYICGQRIKSSTPDKLLAALRLNRLAFVFQTFNLIAPLTALENVALPMQLRGKHSRGQSYRRARYLLEKVGLGNRMNHFPRQLSGGEQQRVTIARAIANSPSILLLDEPTGDLDTSNTDMIMKILLDLNRAGITLVMVTHDMVLKNFAHRIIRMFDGKIAEVEDNRIEIREQYIGELEENLGRPMEGLAVREGIQKYSGHAMESNVALTVEERQHLLKERSSFTDIRTPDQYPFLRHRKHSK